MASKLEINKGDKIINMINHLYDIFKHWTYVDGLHKNSVYLIGDPHFGDEEMKTLRTNYISDDEQVKRINSKVGRNDTIIFLGDIGDVSYIKKIRGYKVLVMGNHDKGASNYKRVQKYIEDYDKGTVEIDLRMYRIEDNHLFDEVYEGPLMINDRIILTHEPIDFLPPFFYNIHGHDHAGSFRSKSHLNVCAEVIGFMPVSLNSIIKDGKLSHIDNIHRLTIDGATERKAKRKGK